MDWCMAESSREWVGLPKLYCLILLLRYTISIGWDQQKYTACFHTTVSLSDSLLRQNIYGLRYNCFIEYSNRGPRAAYAIKYVGRGQVGKGDIANELSIIATTKRIRLHIAAGLLSHTLDLDGWANIFRWLMCGSVTNVSWINRGPTIGEQLWTRYCYDDRMEWKMAMPWVLIMFHRVRWF